ncbi:hypothetical protein ZWY2020_050572 [Hordeum vulgare]|nr:hypothetical protein ZWY2020_050572 [Hordeum vulgare]
MSGGLDDTARALTDVGACYLAAAIFSAKLCRGVLVDLCRENGNVLCRENSFVSLPDDVMLATLARLTDDMDLLRAASTCKDLRRLVADHDSEHWKHRMLMMGQQLNIAMRHMTL